MQKATHTLNPTPRDVMVYAWALARAGARTHGGKPSLYFRGAA